MARRNSRREQDSFKPSRDRSGEKDINLLLLGPTGVGKTTFINALGNYMVYDTLEEAAAGDMQAIIGSSFYFTVPGCFDGRTITIGHEDEHEKFSDKGESNTQLCRSFVFPIGDRNLRLIDTPGIGDTRGFEQDKKNFQEILSYIAQYKYLNAVCILLKPNEERLTVPFRFCVNELLRHLHIDAAKNLIFIFTNARATFFSPGTTKKLVETILNENQEKHGTFIPFSRTNTFLFDNEPFRYLAVLKNGIQFDEKQSQSYAKSWDHSVQEYSKLMAYVVKRPTHEISHMLSLNQAEELIRKLPRPIAETTKLIEENIELAKQHKNNIVNNLDAESEGIPQNEAVVIKLAHPRTVCVGENCCRIININGEKKLEYTSICHDECYLNGVVQETLYDPKLEECTAMDPEEGFCMVCDCHWLQHRHISYEYRTDRIHITGDRKGRESGRKRISLKDIDQRITELRGEANQIRNIYIRLAKFLHKNAIVPVNHDIVDYLQYFLREEQMKQNAGAANEGLVNGIKHQLDEFKSNIEYFTKTIQEQQSSGDMTDIPEASEVFDLVESLFALPINGAQIKQQVNVIKYGQEKCTAHREKIIHLPARAASTQVMKELRNIVSH